MKEFIAPRNNLRVEIIDWENNYQGFVNFKSIKLIGNDYYCLYDEFHYEKLEINSPSMLDKNNEVYITCEDRTVRIKLREFLGLKNHIIRAELGAQNIGLARFEISNNSAEDEECFGQRMWQDALYFLVKNRKISKSTMKKYLHNWSYI